MILPDVNVLVYAHRRDAAQYEAYADWLGDVVAGTEELALADVVLTGFLRVVTNPRIFAEPATVAEGLRFVDALRRAPRVRPVHPSPAAWAAFSALAATDPAIRGNRVPDAWLAALASAHGCRVATADRGFARYGPTVDWFVPVTP